MNDNAQKLVAALRSGEYKQGKGQLRGAGDYFCCLGVACDLYRKETGAGDWVGNGHIWTFVDQTAFLPEAVQEWLGFQYNGGEFLRDQDDPGPRSLYGANDDGRTFAEIADIIESEPKGLFSE